MESRAFELATNFIATAELLFGPMTTDWRYRGIEFRDRPPHLAYYPEEGEVAVSLSLKARDDELQCCFQLAHEVCHLLYPAAKRDSTTSPQATVINEGISTLFSVLMVGKLHGPDAVNLVVGSLAEHSPKYLTAFAQVSELMESDADVIKKIRRIQPRINDLIASDLRAAGIEVSDAKIDALIAVF